jgi:hypothetical protein
MAKERVYRIRDEEKKSDFWKALIESELILEGTITFLINDQSVYA